MTEPVTQGSLIETLLPKDTNAAGHIFGGVVMSLLFYHGGGG
ncbi:MAG: hypothetical protein M0Z31_06445 [Clostridia bacterium]|nr:hypothetical protein [Clostridia bacterium]